MSGVKRELCARYDFSLTRIKLESFPAGTLLPRPTSQWPVENIQLYREFRDWLREGGTARHASETIYLPAAGLVLGLNLKPHAKINLGDDLQKAVVFTKLRGVSENKVRVTGHGVEKFRKFLRWMRGLGEPVKLREYDVAAKTEGLPVWLVQELQRYQHYRQKNWRQARLYNQIANFWDKHLHTWKYLCFEHGVQELGDIHLSQITAMIARDVKAGYSVSTINTFVLLWKGFLAFLRVEDHPVPQALFLVKTIKQPDSLPKYLKDEEIAKLRNEIERQVREAREHSHLRDALLMRANFYLLWQAGLRLGEVEDMLLSDLDFSGKRLTVRNAKGMKDRAVYLTPKVIRALQEYLVVRGPGNTEHLFLYNHAPMKHTLVSKRIKDLGIKVGVRVTPHRLRHSAATQLLNAGCRITSIQKILGHKTLDTTLRYARAYNETVADEFYAAMERVEQRLEILPVEDGEDNAVEEVVEVVKVQDKALVWNWIQRLEQEELSRSDRVLIAASLRQVFFQAGVPPG